MLVKFYGEIARDHIDIDADNIPLILSGIRHICGDDFADNLLINKHYYFLQIGDDINSIVQVHPQMIMSDFSDYNQLIIVHDVSGDGGLIVAAIAGGAFAATTAGVIIATVINVALSIALSFIGQLLSPTLSFDSDPSQAQNKLDSALFNGAPNIREQGGSVPLVFGNTHCGGVLISSGISSEERTI